MCEFTAWPEPGHTKLWRLYFSSVHSHRLDVSECTGSSLLISIIIRPLPVKNLTSILLLDVKLRLGTHVQRRFLLVVYYWREPESLPSCLMRAEGGKKKSVLPFTVQCVLHDKPRLPVQKKKKKKKNSCCIMYHASCLLRFSPRRTRLKKTFCRKRVVKDLFFFSFFSFFFCWEIDIEKRPYN